MNEETANAIGLINNFIEEYISKYDFKLSFELYSNRGFNPTFKIKLPTHITSKEMIKISDEVFDKIDNLANSKNIDFILEDLSIIFSR